MTPKPSITTAKTLIRQLSLKQKYALYEWLSDLIELEEEEELEIPVNSSREVVETLREGAIVFQHERVRCGKHGCRCAEGKLHGPYWYSYQRDGGKVKSRYVGKKLP
jgi:hypothetical protein